MRKSAAAPRTPVASSVGVAETAFYRRLVKDLPFGMAVVCLADPKNSATWRILASNATAKRVAGGSVASFLRLPLATTKKESLNLPAIFRDVLSRRHTRLIGHLHVNRRAGHEVYVVTACPIPNRCIGLIFQEATLLREASRRLTQQEVQIAQICESARAILWRARPETLEFTYIAPQTREILGYWTERWLHESNFWKKRVHPADWRRVEESCAEAFATGKQFQCDCRMFPNRGETRWFRVYVQRLQSAWGAAELAGTMIDITEQKQVALSAREVSVAVMRAQEEERKLISRELHDSVGQHLTGLNYALGTLSRRDGLDKETQEKFRQCLDAVRTCMNEIRVVSYMLRPPLVDLMGLGAALRSYAKKFSQQSGVSIEVDVPKSPECLPVESQMALFRVAQECLTNIQRHAQAKFGRVRLSYEPAEVLLEVEDHGVGVGADFMARLEAGAAGPGVGLLKMRERVTDLNGDLQIQSNGKGTLIRVRIPRSLQAAEAS